MCFSFKIQLYKITEKIIFVLLTVQVIIVLTLHGRHKENVNKKNFLPLKNCCRSLMHIMFFIVFLPLFFGTIFFRTTLILHNVHPYTVYYMTCKCQIFVFLVGLRGVETY